MRTFPLIVLLVAPFAGAAGPARAAAPALAWPVRGPVAERFALSAGAPYARGQHRGVDVAAPAGTPVRAACAGRVRFAGVAGSFGRAVTVCCGRFVISYGHLGAIATAAGEEVARGERIGLVGTTGRGGTRGPHLHLGVRRAADPHGYVDPLALLPAARPPSPPPAPAKRPAGRPPPARERPRPERPRPERPARERPRPERPARERPRPERPRPERVPNPTPSLAAVPDPASPAVPPAVWLGLALLGAAVPGLAMFRGGTARREREGTRPAGKRVAIRNPPR